MNNNQTLTPEEINRIYKLQPYALVDPKTEMLKLYPLQYISDEHAVLLPKWCDSLAFTKSSPGEWLIKREIGKVIVRNKYNLNGFHILTDCGNVEIYADSKFSRQGIHCFATQFYMEFGYDYPVNLGPGHWATGKTAIDLGVAIPNRSILDELLYKKFNNDKEQVELWYHERCQLFKVDLNNLDVFNAEYTLLKSELNIAV